jgi:hypothetical protein
MAEQGGTMRLSRFGQRKQDSPGRVSDDGEVIFLSKASQKEEPKLIEQAFKIRFEPQ